MADSATAQDVLRLLPELVDVYRGAFTAPPYLETGEQIERFGAEQLPQHAEREGFRCVLADGEGELAGFAYGYTGRRGQFWSDYVAARAPADLTAVWVGGHFEFVELAVRPRQQRRGIGSALHDELLEDLPHERALLATWRQDTPARRLYLRKGWEVLVEELDESSSLLGLRLRDPGL